MGTDRADLAQERERCRGGEQGGEEGEVEIGREMGVWM